VWTLGCILYHITSGRPTSAHVDGQQSRTEPIAKATCSTPFPDPGRGGVAVPPSLCDTLRSRVHYNADRWPTTQMLLDKKMDSYLNPEGVGTDFVNEEPLRPAHRTNGLGEVQRSCVQERSDVHGG